jgi:mRNA interferase RelE/StbE
MYTVCLAENLRTKKIPHSDYAKIKKKISLLAEDPRPRWAEELKGRPGYRISVGDYRVIYHINDAARRVVVVAIGHRKDVYRS